jgi:hypothetical protein
MSVVVSVSGFKPVGSSCLQKEDLYVWYEVAIPSLLLVVCNFGGLLSPHHQY